MKLEFKKDNSYVGRSKPFWVHPSWDLLLKMVEDECELYKIKDFLDSFDAEIKFVCFENDPMVSEEVIDKYFDGDCEVLTSWNPIVPDGSGWVLLSIHDTEDGAVSLWGRNK